MDVSNNSTRLTTALDEAYATWSRTDKANFAGYKKRIENILWNDALTVEQKLNMTADVLRGFMPNGTAGQVLLYAVPIHAWGTVCDYVNCVRESADPSYVPQTCPTLSSTSTSTSTTTTTTQPGCQYPAKPNQVGLVVFDDEPRDGDAEEIGSCNCDVGKKAFYNSAPSAVFVQGTNITSVEYTPNQESDCADLCIIDEAGNECKVMSTNAYFTISLHPYCVREKCHVYVGFSNANRDNGLNCGWRNFSVLDLFDGGRLVPMDPDTSPQVYVHAAAFTCQGCGAIKSSNCLKPTNVSTSTTTTITSTPSTTSTTTTTTTTPNECAPLSPNQVGLTRCSIITDNTTQASDPQGLCQCTNGRDALKRQFWTGSDSASPSVAMDASQMAQGPELASIECDDGTIFFLSDQVDASGNLLDLGPQAPYVRAQSVCCDGCIPLENVACTGPTTPEI